jgi:enediyne biosynthesis protein E5
MTPKAPPLLDSSRPATPGAAQPAMKGADSSRIITIRLLATGMLVAGYFSLYARIIDWLTGALHALTGSEPGAAPKVIVVTVLGVLLVALWWKFVKADPRFHAPLLITYILAIGDAMYGILENHTSEWLTTVTGGRVTSYSPTFLAILATVAMEIFLSRFVVGRWPHLASAYISGISVGILIKSHYLWPFILCGLISITSKYVLRIGRRHLWNPSNFGVTMMLFLAGDHVASLSVQSGNELWPILLVWVLGSLILYRLGLLHIPLVFLSVFIPLAFLRSSVTGNPWQAELAPVTWPMFQLYIFFMITDPKTITRRRWTQCLVVIIIAIVETLLRLGFRDVHSLYHALFIVGPISNLIEIWWNARHQDSVTGGA